MGNEVAEQLILDILSTARRERAKGNNRKAHELDKQAAAIADQTAK